MKHWNNITFSIWYLCAGEIVLFLVKSLDFSRVKVNWVYLSLIADFESQKVASNVCRSIFRIIKSCGIIYKENLLFFWVQSESKGTNSVQLAQLTQFYVRQIHQEIFNKESCLKNSPTSCFSTKIEEDSV